MIFKALSIPLILKAANDVGLAAAMLFSSPAALAANGDWTVDAGGTWSTATNGSSNPAVPGRIAGDVVSSALANFGDLPEAYSINYAFNDGVSSNNIALVAVPEPALSMLLGVIGSLCLVSRSRA